MDKLTFNMEKVDEGRVRVEVMYEGKVSMGILYFEKAKVGWTNKPIISNKWRCVDAKVEGLYEVDKATTPKEIVAHCQDLIEKAGY